MECGCVYYADDLEEPACGTSKLSRARKVHICSECGEMIKAGEEYLCIHGIWYGRWQTFKTCRLCQRISRDFFCSYYPLGRLREALFDCIGFDYVAGP